MNILVIDGQGGGLGRELTERILRQYPEIALVAVGTNSAATAAMRKGGAVMTATGENAVVVNARRADVIVGSLGIVMADSMLGEITPRMAEAVSASDAVKILIPGNRCNHYVAGVGDAPLGALIEDAVRRIGTCLS